jgi:hypothetical protein
MPTMKTLLSLVLFLTRATSAFASTLIYNQVLDPSKTGTADTDIIRIPATASQLRVVVQPTVMDVKAIADPTSAPFCLATITGVDMAGDETPFIYLANQPVKGSLVYSIDFPPSQLAVVVIGQRQIHVRVWAR